jgi:hypothetical protein
MTLPRFNLRTGLAWLTGAAVGSVALRAAAQGEPWAIGVAIAVASVGGLLAVHAACFVLSQAISRDRTGQPRVDPRKGGP